MSQAQSARAPQVLQKYVEKPRPHKKPQGRHGSAFQQAQRGTPLGFPLAAPQHQQLYQFPYQIAATQTPREGMEEFQDYIR